MSYSGWTTVQAGPVREVTDVYVCGGKKDRDIEPPYGCDSGDSPGRPTYMLKRSFCFEAGCRNCSFLKHTINPKREFYRDLGFEACAKALKKRWREGEFEDSEKAPPENFCDTFFEEVVHKHRLLQMIDENLIPVEPFCKEKKKACPTAIGKAVKPTGSTSTVQRADVAKVMGNSEPMEDIKST